jgi:carbonic anhydrase/acetyltransferase-like protein (isoleucine patch superfamily)
MGVLAQAGSNGDASSGKVAVGSNVYAGNTSSSNDQVAVGSSCSVNGGPNSVAIGSHISISGTNVAQQTHVAMGANLFLDGNAGNTEILAVGQYITTGATAYNNLTVIGYYNGLSSGAFPAAKLADNTLLIGNAAQAKVYVGAYNLGSINAACGLGGVTVADANYTATNATGSVGYGSITAARTVTLPAANAMVNGQRLLVFDQSGAASGVNTITLARVGADTINGGTSVAINTAYGCRELVSDGVSKWTVIRSM